MSALRKHLVQITDDDIVTCRLLARLFENEGMVAVTAETLEAGREQLRTLPIDLMVMDSQLPDGSGLDQIEFVRTQLHLMDLPVVFYTGNYDEEVIDAATSLGLEGVLKKPAATPVLIRTVVTALKKAPLRWPSPERMRERVPFGPDELAELKNVVQQDIQKLGQDLTTLVEASGDLDSLQADVLRVKSAALTLGGSRLSGFIDMLWEGAQTPSEDLEILGQVLMIEAAALGTELGLEAAVTS